MKKDPKVLESTKRCCLSLKGRTMNMITTIFGISALVLATTATAEGDLSRADIIDVTIETGSNEDGMFFSPDNYKFVTGQAYRLILTNVDEIKHEIALNEMGERIFTRKIEASDPEGNLIIEVKGSISEVEVGPGMTVRAIAFGLSAC
jgi:uncharacterized cupredoxin-like copper-binding protein